MATIIDLSGMVLSERRRRGTPRQPGGEDVCKVLLFSGVRYERLPADTPGHRRGGPGLGGGQPKRRKLKSA